MDPACVMLACRGPASQPSQAPPPGPVQPRGGELPRVRAGGRAAQELGQAQEAGGGQALVPATPPQLARAQEHAAAAADALLLTDAPLLFPPAQLGLAAMRSGLRQACGRGPAPAPAPPPLCRHTMQHTACPVPGPSELWRMQLFGEAAFARSTLMLPSWLHLLARPAAAL